MQNVEALNRDFGRPGAIAFEMSDLGGPVARLSAGDQTAIVALQGAQVLSWQRGEQEQLWLSPVARLGISKPVRGGIPVCWPWFGPHPDDDTKPAHGFVRTRPWDMAHTQIAADRGTVAATFVFATGSEHAALWPYEAQVQLTVKVGTGLSLSLETINRGTRPLILSEALHTYFRVSDIAGVSIGGLDGIPYIDKLDGEILKSQIGPIAIGREVDRIYVGATHDVTLRDGARKLAIKSQGSASAVVWNPWDRKTLRLGDMGSPDAYRHMVCIETANAANDLVMLAPAAHHTMSVDYRVV